MRAKTINPNPPICRSKEATLTYIDIFSCETGELLNHIEKYGLTLPEARGLADGGKGTRSAGYFHEPSFKTFTDLGTDNCPPEPTTIAEAYIYSCIDDTLIEHWEERGLTLAEAQEKADGGDETYSTGYWQELPDGPPVDIGADHCGADGEIALLWGGLALPIMIIDIAAQNKEKTKSLHFGIQTAIIDALPYPGSWEIDVISAVSTPARALDISFDVIGPIPTHHRDEPIQDFDLDGPYTPPGDEFIVRKEFKIDYQ